ncbi:MAG: hypothetical protein ACI8ZN_001326 [Bacteroidia bacterium]|jgi:uncharacterized protein (DUF983 family)
MRTKQQAFLTGQCPQCRSGRIFKNKFLHKNFKDVNPNCPHCHVKFESEPGFFWGAMYFSYGLIVGTLMVSGIVLYSIQDQPPLFQTSGIMIGLSLLLTPVYLRLSRLMMIYIAAPYKNFKEELYKA